MSEQNEELKPTSHLANVLNSFREDEEKELLEKFEKAKELMDESLKIKADIKIANKAKRDATKRIVDELQIDPGFIKYVMGALASKGEEKGDKLKSTFSNLADVLISFRETRMSSELEEYLSGLEAQGIHIEFETKGDAPDTVKEGFKDCISYIRNVKDMNKTISDEHATSSEDMSWAPKKEYKEVLQAYSNKLKGKETADDDIHDKIAFFEMAETAYNMIEGVEAID